MNPRNHAAPPVASGRALLRSAAGLRLLGIDVRPALARIGLTPDQLGELGEVIPLHWLYDFWDAVVKDTGECGLGLRIAEQVRPEAYEVFGCLIAASSTLGEAALRGTRLIGLATKTVRFSLHHEGDQVTFAVEPFYPDLVHRETIEFMVGALSVIARRIADRPLGAREVCFTHDEPADLSHHRRLFVSPIRFGAVFNGMVFDGSLLDIPIPNSDSTLSAKLRQQAEELMVRDEMVGFKAQVRAALANELRGGDPSAERVAGVLALHPKTLSRRLKAEGTTSGVCSTTCAWNSRAATCASLASVSKRSHSCSATRNAALSTARFSAGPGTLREPNRTEPLLTTSSAWKTSLSPWYPTIRGSATGRARAPCAASRRSSRSIPWSAL